MMTTNIVGCRWCKIRRHSRRCTAIRQCARGSDGHHRGLHTSRGISNFESALRLEPVINWSATTGERLGLHRVRRNIWNQVQLMRDRIWSDPTNIWIRRRLSENHPLRQTTAWKTAFDIAVEFPEGIEPATTRQVASQREISPLRHIWFASTLPSNKLVCFAARSLIQID